MLAYISVNHHNRVGFFRLNNTFPQCYVSRAILSFSSTVSLTFLTPLACISSLDIWSKNEVFGLPILHLRRISISLICTEDRCLLVHHFSFRDNCQRIKVDFFLMMRGIGCCLVLL